MKKKNKEKTEAIFIRNKLKSFLEEKKMVLKKEKGKFYGIPETLMYYLEDSDKFKGDYTKYCEVLTL